MTKIADKTYLFEQMPVRKALLKQIVPAVISQMIVLIYSLADTYFVGLLNDPRQTAAVTVVSSVFLMLTAVSNLFAVGGASLAARTLGRREDEKAKDICALSFWGALLASVLFSLLFWSLVSPILYLCGATADTYPFAFGYAKWVVLIGGAGTVLNVLLANLIRAEGNALVAALGVSLGGICNIVLDPIFVLPRFLNLGAAGAGAATAISNTAAALFFILVCRGKTAVNYRQPFTGAAKARTQAHQRYPRRRFSVRRAICADRRFDRRHFKIRFGICHGGRRRAGHRQKAGPAPAVLLHRRGKRAAAVFGL